MHPHGVLYNKSSEGSPYMDGTWGYDKDDDSVVPGANHTYIWHVRAFTWGGAWGRQPAAAVRLIDLWIFARALLCAQMPDRAV